MQTLNQIDVQSKTVLLRVDYNVPVQDGVVTDTARIEETVPTITYLREHGAKIVIMAHFGRPKGKVNDELRFKPVVSAIERVLGVSIAYAPEAIDSSEVAMKVVELQPGEVLLLENIRFYPGEETNDPAFALQLAKLGDVYVNDAFGAAHRAHASTAGVAGLLPHAAGLLMQREVEELSKVLNSPEHPVVAIIGGSKISSKIDLIRNLMPKVDKMLLGGALANTILLAQGKPVGESLVEKELAATLTDLMNDKLFAPVDVVTHEGVVKSVNEVSATDKIFDLGPETVKLYAAQMQGAKMVLWNGPMGIFEQPAFAKATLGVAQAVAASGAYSVLGGGETVAAIHQAGLQDKVSFISTGGGAMLEFLEGKILPGIKALD